MKIVGKFQDNIISGQYGVLVDYDMGVWIMSLREIMGKMPMPPLKDVVFHFMIIRRPNSTLIFKE